MAKRKKGLAAVLGTVVSIAVPMFAPAIAGAVFGSASIASAMAIGAAGGAAGAALQGGNVLQGAVLGGVGGGLSGASAGLNTAGAVTKNGVAIQQGASTAGFGPQMFKAGALDSIYTGTQLASVNPLVSPNISSLDPIYGGITSALPQGTVAPASNVVNAPLNAAPMYTTAAPAQAPTQTQFTPQPQAQPQAGLNTQQFTPQQTYSAQPMAQPTVSTMADPASSIAAQQAAKAGGQTATRVGASTPAAQTAAAPQQQSGLRGMLSRVDPNTALRLGGALFSPGEADIPNYDDLFASLNGENSPDAVNQQVLDSADAQDAMNREQFKYQLSRTRQLAQEADAMDPQEYARMQALVEGERAGTLSREQQRELARRRGRNTGKRGAAGQRRAGLDMARATAVGDRAGFERGNQAKLAFDAAARAWLPSNFQAADATRLNVNTSGMNAAQQEETWRRQKYELEQAAAQRERERTATVVGLTTGLFNRQPGQATEQNLWR